MRTVAVLVLLGLIAPVGVAHADDCWPVPGCYISQPTLQLDGRTPTTIGGAAVATGVAAGLAAAAAARKRKMPTELPLPAGVVEVVDENGNKRLGLQLIPTPPPLAYVPAESRPQPHEAFRLNDIATTSIILAGGVAILTSIIVGFARR